MLNQANSDQETYNAKFGVNYDSQLRSKQILNGKQTSNQSKVLSKA